MDKLKIPVCATFAGMNTAFAGQINVKSTNFQISQFLLIYLVRFIYIT
jgi:hypothetical protein